MASPAQEKRVPDLPVANTITSDTLVLVVSSSDPSASPAIFDTTSLTPVKSLPVAFANTPANSTAIAITKGLSWTDGNYLYLATANNVVKRITLSSF